MEDSPLRISRREVLAAAAATAILAPSLQAWRCFEQGRRRSRTFARATRWVQLALVEKDPATFDPDWWLDFFQRVHAGGACISAGGMCAFYPTEIPFHHRSEWLGDKDVFGYLVEGCRKLNMAVIARVDPHCIRDDAAQAHPEWVAVDATGQKVRHMVMKDRWLSCATRSVQLRISCRRWSAKSSADTASTRSSPIAGPGTLSATATRARPNSSRPPVSTPRFDATRRRLGRVPALAQRSAVRSVGHLGCRRSQKVKPDACCLMNQGNVHNGEMTRIGQRAEMVAADRQAAKWRPSPLARRLECQSVPQRDGRQAGGRHHQRRHRRRCPSLERLGAKPRRVPPLDAGMHRPRHAAVVRQIQRYDVRPPLDPRRRGRLQLARRPTSGFSIIDATWLGWRRLVAADLSDRRQRTKPRPANSASLMPWSRPAFRLRWSTSSCWIANTWSDSSC